jgi:hypothetical protein
MDSRVKEFPPMRKTALCFMYKELKMVKFKLAGKGESSFALVNTNESTNELVMEKKEKDDIIPG